MTSREKFEQAIKARFGDSIDYRVCKNGDGGYMAWDMQVAWWAWQAAETDMAVQLANAESKCRELTAELSAVDKIHNEAVFITDDHYEQCPPEVQKIIRSLAVLQIPSCDAFLAEVRAQGVESGINTVIAMMNHQHPATSQAIDILQTHAAQLRKGAAL
ncbi:TPA: hypothetical protein ACGR4J_002835 [Citrobacter braakii]|uniref:hypothetical protein n=1 Tax=Citrobacter TaxID=544 RepID=UPI002575BCB0|nr:MULTISPECIES: hypothetical protein [Citrobacter]MDM3310709.1 hypothetical protein [Citrobacter sp. Cb223]MEB0958086.1 hypothetical protein [Citrobacter braakii]MEB0987890.1 hypothetical protein [Citrobacter braakii]